MRRLFQGQLKRQFSTLYTWGDYGLGTGQKIEAKSFSLFANLWGSKSSHQKVTDLEQSMKTSIMMGDNGKPVQIMQGVQKIAMGQSHSIVINADGKLLSTGNGKNLALGNDSSSVVEQFVEIDYFKDIKCVDVDCDHDYTVVLDNEGKVYVFGRGQKVQQLQIDQKIKHISAGKGYGFAVAESNQTYTWGLEKHGCHGDGMSELNKTIPVINFRLAELLNKKSIYPVKIRNAGYSTMMLMNNNEVWACGENVYGQLGLREVQGRVTDIKNWVLKKISDTHLQGQEVLDIDLSIACSLIMTKDQDGKQRVYVSGLNQNKKPLLVNQVVDPVGICATEDCYYVLEKNGQVVISHADNCLNGQYTHPVSGKITVSNEQFDRKQPSKIGGNYGIHYVLC